MNSVPTSIARAITAALSTRTAQLAILLVMALATVSSSFAGPIITVEIGRQSRGCTGFGICSITIGLGSERAVPASTDLAGNRMMLQFMKTPVEHQDVLTVEEDIALDAATSRMFGYKQVTILKGTYPVDYSTNPNGVVRVDVQTAGITVTINVGRRSRGCTGFGICDIIISTSSAERAVPGVATMHDGMLDLDLLGTAPDHGDLLTLDEDVVLDDATSRALGYQQVTVRKGEYRVDYSSNPNGHVLLPVQTVGITINIKIGRRSSGCRGFGICEIWIGADIADRTVPSSVSVDGGTLKVDFLGKLPEQGDVMTIDEDIVLDNATSLALGYQQITIRKGSYPVDYSHNPNGHVDLNMSRIGITITIEVGRRSKGCTGFGICSVTVGIDLTERSVPGVATLNGDMIDIDLRSMPRDRGDLLMLDEDVVLDDATSRAFGCQRLTLRKGGYAVDYSSNPYGHVQIPVSRIGITITIEVGRRSKGCTGFGICSITIGAELTERSVGSVASTDGHTMHIDFLGNLPERGDVLTIDEDIVLDDATARAFGYQHLTIRKGEYGVDYSSNPNGHVDVDVASIGITINVTIGKPSQNCSGFGICKISIGFDLSAKNNVPGIASVQHGKLMLDLLGSNGLHEEWLPIEEDIVLDSATSRALGYRQVTIRKGIYPVDYKSNPNGHVELDVATMGITIYIKIGRPSRNCTGFGVCEISVGLSLADRSVVPAIAVSEDGSLALELLAKPTEEGDTLVVEEDIVLDEATAQALGLTQLRVKKGSYIVDRSTNPNGTLRLAASTAGSASVRSQESGAAHGSSLAAQVSPNPTSGTATIGFVLPKSERVTVTVLNARGEVVARLLDGELLATGAHSVSFDGSALPSGAYFYTVRAGAMMETHAMQIAR
jgi:hypothetical protein